jgi:O-acetylhomoserine (thiol)-lyase
MTERIPGFATLAVHAGAQPDPTTGARATPIYQTTSYVFESVDHAASLFGLSTFGNIYTRIGNPTTAVLEERVAALEGGTAGLATASGHAAQMMIFHCLLQPGDEFVASRKLYGGSINQFTHAFKNFGWNVVWADPDDIISFERAVSPKTKAIFTESIANPGGVITDMAAVGQIARRAGVPYIVDNTLATPYLCKPIDHGADVVIHSLTKFLGGHGNSIGGLISPSPSPAGCWRCAISARRSHRSTPSSFLPASRHCRCACAPTATMRKRSPNGWRRIRKWPG